MLPGVHLGSLGNFFRNLSLPQNLAKTFRFYFRCTNARLCNKNHLTVKSGLTPCKKVLHSHSYLQ